MQSRITFDTQLKIALLLINFNFLTKKPVPGVELVNTGEQCRDDSPAGGGGGELEYKKGGGARRLA